MIGIPMSSSYEDDRPRRDRAPRDDRRGPARRDGSRGQWRNNSGQRNQGSSRRGDSDRWRLGEGPNSRRWDGNPDRSRRNEDRDDSSRGSSWQPRSTKDRGQRRQEGRGTDRWDSRGGRWSGREAARDAGEHRGYSYRERDAQRRDSDGRTRDYFGSRQDGWDEPDRRGEWRGRDRAQAGGAGRGSFRGGSFDRRRRDDGGRRSQWGNDQERAVRRDGGRDARARNNVRDRDDRRGQRDSRGSRGGWRGDRETRSNDRGEWHRSDRRGISRPNQGREIWRDDRELDRDRDDRRGGWRDRRSEQERDPAPRDDRRGQWRDNRRRYDRRGDKDDHGRYDRDRGRRVDESERPLPPGLEPADNEPQLPVGYDESQLPPGVRAELKGVNKQMATVIGGHLQAAGELVDIDPDLALRHVMVARRLGSRLPVVREMAAEVAYAVEAFSTALTEYRALHRMTGNDDYLPVIADCERAVGKHQNALRTLRDAQQARLSPAQRIEAVLVEAGIREDLGQRPEAARLLKQAIGANQGGHQEQARLRVAYANLLASNGQVEQALEWLASARKHDRNDVLGVDALIAVLRGEEIEPESDEFEIMDVEEYHPDPGEDSDGDLLPEDAITTHGAQDLDENSVTEDPETEMGDEKGE